MCDRRLAALVACLALSASAARAASLDVTAAYKMKALQYKNLNLDESSPFSKNDRSFIDNDARLGIAVRKIALETRGGEESTMDVALQLHAIGVAGSTGALTAPFDRAANYYPSTDLTPFIENAYLRVHRLFGKDVDATFGRQSFRLGGGLLLDDDGAGLTGVTLRAALPWLGMQVQGFIFDDKNPNPNVSAPNNSLTLFGASLDLPTEGVWQLNELVERDKAGQTVYGCSFLDAAGVAQPCAASKATRSFTSAHYQLNYGPMVFDGEAALEKGVATPTGLTPAPNHITYNGDAEVVRAKWKQRLYKTGEGIARISVARGSGDKPDTLTTDEAFFPSHGHRYSGLERSGFGDFFGATPYDAWGGNYSSTTASGLTQGASGILVVGAGYTPPAWNGIVLDVDYYLFQADRIKAGPRTLGTEWDVHLRYAILDRFTLAAGGAFFSTGTATNPAKSSAKRYFFEASGRF